MICNKCGVTLPDDATVCAQCGEVVEAVAPAVEETPVVEEPAAVEEAPVVEKTAPAKVGFFEKIGGFVAKIPLLGKIKFLQTKAGIIVSAVAILCAIAILFSSVVGVLIISNSPRTIAKKYIKAAVRGDIKATYSMQAGKMKKYDQDSNEEYKEQLFEYLENRCAEEGINVRVNNYNQYYRAYEKLNKALMKEEFGALRIVRVKVDDVEKMTATQLEAFRTKYAREQYDGYINPNRIRKGKIIHITVTIDGTEGSDTFDTTIKMIKYKGKWKVAT